MISYPIKFKPILKETIWGGRKLVEQFNKKSSAAAIGESWEVSGVENNISIVANGDYEGVSLNELIEHYPNEFLGNNSLKKFGKKFPLLIKFIDANDDLSVQVHPDDALAQKRNQPFGKTEMWYVMEHEKDASLILGFTKDVSREEYVQRVANKSLFDILQQKKVATEDMYFIEAGTVHAIGKGIVIAEIQQTSDTTYRIYDYDRVDTNGKGRELHTELALDAINFNQIDTYITYNKQPDRLTEVVSCNYFTTSYLKLTNTFIKDYESIDSFIIFMCVDGNGMITTNDISVDFTKGETILVPANTKEVIIDAEDCTLLEVHV